MVAIVKFDCAEARVAFDNFLDDAMGLSLCVANGAKNGWVISFNNDLASVFDYLHDLGAFKWYDEE